jgi:flagellar motility protein MotE (MotC chaperone)
MIAVKQLMIGMMFFLVLTAPAWSADPPKGDIPQADVEETSVPEPPPELIFQGLEAKRIALVERGEAIRLEEKKLKELKAELDLKREELEALRQQIETGLSRLEAKEKTVNESQRLEEEKKIKQLVKVYSSMKPKQAAAIINNMDIVIAERLFMNLKGDVAGKILAYVDQEKAARISERLAETLEDLPEVE